MKNNPLAVIIIAVALVYSVMHRKPAGQPAAGDHSGLFARLLNRLDGMDIQLVKIESLVTLVKAEQEARAASLAAAIDNHSSPLRAEDLVSPQFVTAVPSITAPLVHTSLSAIAQPATPGMEPAKEPTKSVPARPAQPAKASGRWETYGLLGRRRRWVPTVPASYAQNQVQYQRSGVPVLRRFGSCRGGSFGN